MKLRKIASLLLAICLLSSTVFAYDDLDLSAGAAALGGNLSFPMQFDKGQAPQIAVTIAPVFNYFFVDGLAFVLGGTYKRLLMGGDKTANFGLEKKNYWGLNVGLQYYLDLGAAAFPYLGASAEFGWDGTGGTNIRAVAPVGVLLSLNEHVGVDIGVRVNVDFGVSKTDVTRNGYQGVGLEPGYLGVKAFF